MLFRFQEVTIESQQDDPVAPTPKRRDLLAALAHAVHD